MKIALLFYDVYKAAGIQRSICNLANAFVSSGHEVTIITTTFSNKTNFVFDKKVSFYYISLDEVDSSGPLSWIKKVNWAVKFHKKILSFLETSGIDFLIDNGTAWGLLNSKNKIKGVKIILFRHFPLKKFPYGNIMYTLLKYFSKDKNLVVLTRDIQHQFISNGYNNVSYIPNPIPNFLFRFPRKEQTPLGKIKFISIGRANAHQKGFDLLLKSMYLANSKNQDFELEILGPGIDKDSQLLNLIRKYNLLGKVFLKPQTQDIYNLIHRSDILIISSRYEGLPMIALESLAIGTPVLSFEVDGVKDIINNGINGILVRELDCDMLAKKIIYLIENRKLIHSMALNAKQSVVKFKSSHIVKIWTKYLREEISL